LRHAATAPTIYATARTIVVLFVIVASPATPLAITAVWLRNPTSKPGDAQLQQCFGRHLRALYHQTMPAELRDLDSADAAEGFASFALADPERFSITVGAIVGPAGGEGGDPFYFNVVTAAWLAEHPPPKGFEFVRDLLVSRWNRETVWPVRLLRERPRQPGSWSCRGAPGVGVSVRRCPSRVASGRVADAREEVLAGACRAFDLR
jgi:hypothetical protein